MALLADTKLQKTTPYTSDFMYDSLLNSWNEIIKKCKLGELSNILRWCAYDSEFVPNKYDDRFKRWISKGLTTYHSFIHKGAFSSFETLKTKYGLGQDDFYRYLQIRHYFHQNLKTVYEQKDLGFLQIFLTLTRSHSQNNIISRLYKGIQQCTQGSTEDIKKRWEKEGNMVISHDSWANICQFQWTITGSNTWREFSWKNMIRYFITPIQKRHLGGGDACWRLCGVSGANHFHIFWECQVISNYWTQIGEHVNNVFGTKIPLKCETLYLGDVPVTNWNNNDKKLLGMLLIASKKAITRKWMRVESPTIEDWTNIIHGIYVMEKLSFSLRMQKDIFYKIWTKWTEYIKPLRSDFV
uniref:Reverse transcriptase n=1 Tax=Fundulus heteroclitus TaxID=8078 RepID=A0A146S7T5_FUNHE